jgi:DNA excision repair protein ERCC-4
MSAKNRVIVDERERASEVPDLLKEFGLMVDYRMLEVGDYITSAYAVERKEIRDFLKSLYSKRIFDQASRLSKFYENPLMIVEGSITNLIDRKIKVRSFFGGLAALTFDYGMKVFFTQNADQTANLIYVLSKRRSSISSRPIIKKKPKAEETEKLQLQIVSSLPGIGIKLADRLLRERETVRKVFASSTAELSAIKGVGRVTAYKIARVLDASYRPIPKRPQQLRLDS